MEENEYVQKIHELEQELKVRVEDNAELYTKLCNALNQLNEANEVIKHIKLLKIKTNDCEMTIEAICPEAEQYLKKWGVK